MSHSRMSSKFDKENLNLNY